MTRGSWYVYPAIRHPLLVPVEPKLTHPPLQAKMVYASSKEALKRALTGIAVELQANDADDIEYESVVKTVSKGLAVI